MSPTWPPLHAYARAHRCSTCGAEPGTDCDAPKKLAGQARRNRLRNRFGMPPDETDPIDLMHATRQDAAIRHYRRDVRNAPWPEDRVPGQRYDTLDLDRVEPHPGLPNTMADS